MERRQVLLAGGIGSGKSEVGRLLALLGACVIDADEVGHHVLEPGGESYVSVAAAFPGALMDGAIDRRVLAAEVFADPIRLRLLESLTHPAIRERIHRLVEACDSHVVVVEIPLISDFLGGGWVRVVADAPTHTRLRRLVGRGVDPADARARMEAQPTREEWRASADILVDNSGDWVELGREVERVWALLTA